MYDMMDASLNEWFNKKDQQEMPSQMEMVLYLFWEKGISYNEFKSLPIPYIMGILKAHNYIQKEQEKEMKKKK